MLARVIREDITLLVDASPVPAWARVDPNQIEQVLLNLVINARDALPMGGDIHLSVSVAEPPSGHREASPHRGPFVCLQVGDNGIGMPPEVRARLFEPFFTTKGVGQGTGLGLASVYGIVSQSNGLITVETEEGTGTTFALYFPMASAPDAPGIEDRPGPEDTADRETVLLVEDEDAVRRVIRAMLQRNGYRVIDTGKPSEAREIFERRLHEIRLLVTDVVMPGMNGPALARELVSLQPDLRVLFISGYTDIDPATLGLDHPNLAFLAKPIQAPRLAAKVRELFAVQ
jgi:CheY-like chemotaxis protein